MLKLAIFEAHDLLLYKLECFIFPLMRKTVSGACFSKVPKLFGPISGATIFPLYLRNAEVLSHQTFAIPLDFRALKHAKRSVDCSLTIGFSSPKTYRDFRGTGPSTRKNYDNFSRMFEISNQLLTRHSLDFLRHEWMAMRSVFFKRELWRVLLVRKKFYIIKEIIHGCLEIWNFSSSVQFDIWRVSAAYILTSIAVIAIELQPAPGDTLWWSGSLRGVPFRDGLLQ